MVNQYSYLKLKHLLYYTVNEFEKHGQILQLAPVLPTKEPKLEPECYEAICN